MTGFLHTERYVSSQYDTGLSEYPRAKSNDSSNVCAHGMWRKEEGLARHSFVNGLLVRSCTARILVPGAKSTVQGPGSQHPHDRRRK